MKYQTEHLYNLPTLMSKFSVRDNGWGTGVKETLDASRPWTFFSFSSLPEETRKKTESIRLFIVRKKRSGNGIKEFLSYDSK